MSEKSNDPSNQETGPLSQRGKRDDSQNSNKLKVTYVCKQKGCVDVGIRLVDRRALASNFE